MKSPIPIPKYHHYLLNHLLKKKKRWKVTMRSSGKYKWNKQLHAEKNYNRMRNSQVWRRIEILKGWRKKNTGS